jgi:hypothetical protein
MASMSIYADLYFNYEQTEQILDRIKESAIFQNKLLDYGEIKLVDGGLSLSMELYDNINPTMNVLLLISKKFKTGLRIALRDWGAPDVVPVYLFYKGKRLARWTNEACLEETMGYEAHIKAIVDSINQSSN